MHSRFDMRYKLSKLKLISSVVSLARFRIQSIQMPKVEQILGDFRFSLDFLLFVFFFLFVCVINLCPQASRTTRPESNQKLNRHQKCRLERRTIPHGLAQRKKSGAGGRWNGRCDYWMDVGGTELQHWLEPAAWESPFSWLETFTLYAFACFHLLRQVLLSVYLWRWATRQSNFSLFKIKWIAVGCALAASTFHLDFINNLLITKVSLHSGRMQMLPRLGPVLSFSLRATVASGRVAAL